MRNRLVLLCISLVLLWALQGCGPSPEDLTASAEVVEMEETQTAEANIPTETQVPDTPTPTEIKVPNVTPTATLEPTSTEIPQTALSLFEEDELTPEGVALIQLARALSDEFILEPCGVHEGAIHAATTIEGEEYCLWDQPLAGEKTYAHFLVLSPDLWSLSEYQVGEYRLALYRLKWGTPNGIPMVTTAEQVRCVFSISATGSSIEKDAIRFPIINVSNDIWESYVSSRNIGRTSSLGGNSWKEDCKLILP